MFDETIGFIGGGQMARALAAGFVAGELISESQVCVADPVEAAIQGFRQRLPKATVCDCNRNLVQHARVVFLAVKPQMMAEVLANIRSGVDDQLFVSIAAGISLATLTEGLGTQRVVRVMPNTPCLVGCGASGFACADGVLPEERDLVHALLSAVGEAIALDEKLLDAVTGLSGSGPAYVYQFIEALSDGGVRMGLPRDVAQRLAAATVQGAAEMVLQSGDHPAVLKDRVASPGGTTIAGLHVLEQAGLRAGVMGAVEAATRRSQELGKS